MISEVTWPEEVSQNGYSASGIFLDGPAAIGFVNHNVIEEILLENGIFFLQSLLLFLLLRVPEMRVGIQFEYVLRG